MKKIAIVSVGRSHLINLARELSKKEDLEVIFYTMMPKMRCKKYGYSNGKIISYFFPLGILYLIFERIPFLSKMQHSYLRFLIRKAVDIFTVLFLRPCDYFISLNGVAVKSSMIAQKKFKAITICDQGSSHIYTQSLVHNSYATELMPQWNIDYMISHYKVSNYFMVASKYVAESDMKNGIPDNQILINAYGVNTDIFKPTFNPQNMDSAFDVIMVGSWWKHKGCDMLLEACIDILKIKLLHVGAIIDCPIPKNPLFVHVDFVSEFLLAQYYSKAKVFVLPSLDEGFGLVLLQAVASGLPIVYSKNTGGPMIKELLNDSPFCVEIEDPLTPVSIANAIQKALSLVNSLPSGKRCYCHDQLKNITWKAYADRYYNILKRLKK